MTKKTVVSRLVTAVTCTKCSVYIYICLKYQRVRSLARLNLCDAKKFLRYDSLTVKKLLLLKASKRKEVLAFRRTQAQASAIGRKKLPGLRTQNVLGRALFLGCTVHGCSGWQSSVD